MSLQELLDSVGLNKSELARLMGVSRKTITRLGDEVNDAVIKAVELHQKQEAEHNPETEDVFVEIEQKDVPMAETKFKDAMDCSEDEIRAIWKRRGTETDYDIAHSLGVNVFQFRRDYIDPQVARFAR